MDMFSELTFENVRALADLIMMRFREELFDVAEVAYGSFKNPAVQYPKAEIFLPVPKAEKKEGDRKADYIFEPDQESLLEYLIPSILQTQFFKYLLDTHASEHGARMTAMSKATDNADELLADLENRVPNHFLLHDAYLAKGDYYFRKKNS